MKKGVSEIAAGLVAMLITAWGAQGRPWWVIIIAGFVLFLSWATIIEGASRVLSRGRKNERKPQS